MPGRRALMLALISITYMINLRARIRRIQRLVLRVATGKKELPSREQANNNHIRRRARLVNSRAIERRSVRSAAQNVWAGPSSLDLAAFCSDLESLRASMSEFAIPALPPNNCVEYARDLFGANSSLEDDVALAVQLLPARAVTA